jgi:hypothetical protein
MGIPLSQDRWSVNGSDCPFCKLQERGHCLSHYCARYLVKAQEKSQLSRFTSQKVCSCCLLEQSVRWADKCHVAILRLSLGQNGP